MTSRLFGLLLVAAVLYWLLAMDGFTTLGELWSDAEPEIRSCVKGEGAPKIKCPELQTPGGGR